MTSLYSCLANSSVSPHPWIKGMHYWIACSCDTFWERYYRYNCILLCVLSSIPQHARVCFQMSASRSQDDLVEAWEELRKSHKGLPHQLRKPQKDALFWLNQGKSVLLCIGTGFILKSIMAEAPAVNPDVYDETDLTVEQAQVSNIFDLVNSACRRCSVGTQVVLVKYR